MKKDITILFLTVNKVPKKWTDYQKETLLEASWGCPIITISREPLDWGYNIIGTTSGLTKFDRDKESFTRYKVRGYRMMSFATY